NAIAAALDAAGKPLSADQATSLDKLTREFSDEDARRLQAYDEKTYALKKTSDEADLRARFFDAAFKVLREDQRDALTPPATKGRLGLDLYSDGLLWITVMRPLQFKDKDVDALAGEVVTAVGGRLKLPSE